MRIFSVSNIEDILDSNSIGVVRLVAAQLCFLWAVTWRNRLVKSETLCAIFYWTDRGLCEILPNNPQPNGQNNRSAYSKTMYSAAF